MKILSHIKSPMPEGRGLADKKLAAIKPTFGGTLGPVALALLGDVYLNPVSGSTERQTRLKLATSASTRLGALATNGYLTRIESSGKLAGYKITNKGRAAIGKPLVQEAVKLREPRICPSSMRAIFDPSTDVHMGRIGLAMCQVSGR